MQGYILYNMQICNCPVMLKVRSASNARMASLKFIVVLIR